MVRGCAVSAEAPFSERICAAMAANRCPSSNSPWMLLPSTLPPMFMTPSVSPPDRSQGTASPPRVFRPAWIS